MSVLSVWNRINSKLFCFCLHVINVCVICSLKNRLVWYDFVIGSSCHWSDLALVLKMHRLLSEAHEDEDSRVRRGFGLHWFSSGKWIQCLQGQSSEEDEGDYRYFKDLCTFSGVLFAFYFQRLCFDIRQTLMTPNFLSFWVFSLFIF